MVRGDLQRYYTLKKDIYTSILAMRSLCILTAVATERSYTVESLDAINAFLLAILGEDERFLVRLPLGIYLIDVIFDSDTVAELQLPLYDLRIAPRK